MSQIEQLIQQYCPDGVEWKCLGDFCEIKTGKGITKKDCVEYGEFPIISGGVEPMGYYHTYNREGRTVTISRVGANAGLVSFIEKRFYLNDKCFSVIPSNKTNTKFLYYILSSIESSIKGMQSEGGVPTINTQKVGGIEIPLPPLPVQEEIAKILDTFSELQTELQSELQTELQSRQQQYQYYRDKLLSFEGRSDVKWTKLGEVCEIGTGSHNTQDGLSEGLYSFYTRGSEVLYLNDYDYDETAIITAGDGAGVGKVFHFVQGKYALHQRAYRIVPDKQKVSARYLYYYIGATFYNYIMKSSVSSSVVSIRKPMMVNYPIPLPPLSVQEDIASTLDRFDALVNDLSQGIPAEIEARKQQFEYYRDKLLTFKKQ